MNPPPRPFQPEMLPTTNGVRAFFSFDQTWGRPVFHPPALPSPRIMIGNFPALVRCITHFPPPASGR